MTPLRWVPHSRATDAPLLSHVPQAGTGTTFVSRLAVCGLAVLLAVLAGCQVERRKSDAELGLNSTQSTGRAIYDRQCGGCHEAYSSRGLNGPSLQGMFRHPYMKNGMPANDERVRDIVVLGRAMMPGYGRVLSPQQVDELMAYLHTL
jgi:mono/diheme cytochrome c family protein